MAYEFHSLNIVAHILYILYWFSIFLFVVNVAGLFILSMATLVPANKGNKFLCGIIYNYIDCAKFLFQID